MREHTPRRSGRSAVRLLCSGLGALSSAFIALTIAAAHQSGALPDRATPPFPWVDVLTICGILVLQTAILGRTLHTGDAMPSWRQLALALLYGVALLPLSALYFATNTPRYQSMPGLFSLTTTVGVLATMAVLAIRSLVRGRWPRWPARTIWKG